MLVRLHIRSCSNACQTPEHLKTIDSQWLAKIADVTVVVHGLQLA